MLYLAGQHCEVFFPRAVLGYHLVAVDGRQGVLVSVKGEDIVTVYEAVHCCEREKPKLAVDNTNANHHNFEV